MNKYLLLSITFILGIFACAVLVWYLIGHSPPSVTLEYLAPDINQNEKWHTIIKSGPSDDAYNGYSILERKRSPVAIGTALEQIHSDDDYLWLNASSYLGSFGKPEAVPFLIKSLRHTAWRGDADRVRMLQSITGERFGNDFESWRSWYLESDNAIDINWESNLGFRPRLKKDK